MIGDLPAGQYAIVVYYRRGELHHSVFIRSGEITFFTLRVMPGTWMVSTGADSIRLVLQTA